MTTPTALTEFEVEYLAALLMQDARDNKVDVSERDGPFNRILDILVKLGCADEVEELYDGAVGTVGKDEAVRIARMNAAAAA